ncbi:hypothetical protein C1889_00740 [Pseudomonas sp. FW507-12TSA]|nr:hypothetical protein C1889_00740 [Pseudomonas sp. FW507-12TSA]
MKLPTFPPSATSILKSSRRLSRRIEDGQCQVSFINLPCGQYTSGSTARRSDELAHNTFASSPDRGDACIMQGRNPLVNGFVVKIFKHYILSDKSRKAIIQAPKQGRDR